MAPQGQPRPEPLVRVRARDTCWAPLCREAVLVSAWSVPGGLPSARHAGASHAWHAWSRPYRDRYALVCAAARPHEHGFGRAATATWIGLRFRLGFRVRVGVYCGALGARVMAVDRPPRSRAPCVVFRLNERPINAGLRSLLPRQPQLCGHETPEVRGRCLPPATHEHERHPSVGLTARTCT